MKSIRARLMVGLIVGIVLVELVAGFGVYFLIHHAVHREYDTSLNAKAASLASAVHFEDGHVDLELNELLRAEFSKREDAEYFELLDGSGKPIARSPSLGSSDLPTSDRHVFDLTLPDGDFGRAAKITFSPELDAEERAKNPTTQPMVTLIVAANSEQLHHTLEKVARSLTLAGIAIALVSAVLVYLMVTRELRPLRTLSNQAAAMSAATLSKRFGAELPEEMRPIAHALNDLLARLEQAFERERRFSADVAHELRTPVAEIRTMCEVALMDADNLKTNQRALKDVQESAQHMSDLVDRLLALARCESGRQAVELRDVDLRPLVERVWRNLEPADQKLELSGNSVISADPAMIEAITTNLLNNALEYSLPGSVIRGFLSDHELTIRNPQTKLSHGDLAHIFEPFWRKDTARTSGNHAGIGLSLVSAYCNALGATVEANLTSEGEFEIRVRFRTPGLRYSEDPGWPPKGTTSALSQSGDQ